ncbi:MAG: DUF4129 domain-containing protein [Oceanihabitans sp.]
MRCILITLTVLLTCSLAFCQADSLSVQIDDSTIIIKKIEEKHLKKYHEDSKFNYNEETTNQNFITKAILWLKNIIRSFFEWLFGVGNATGILKFILNTLPYLILAFLIYLIFKFFLKVNSRNIISGKQNPSTIHFSEEENIIKNEDINQLINQAIAQKNYRLAIRYYYLLSLKILSDNQTINWQTQKTNADYISEIQTKNIQSSFINITRIYDYVWYGEFFIDAVKFEKLKQPFETLNKKLKIEN